MANIAADGNLPSAECAACAAWAFALICDDSREGPHAVRASSLTKVLAQAFAAQSRRELAVICTVSPCASDTEHTVETLRLGGALAGRGEKEEKAGKCTRYASPLRNAPNDPQCFRRRSSLTSSPPRTGNSDVLGRRRTRSSGLRREVPARIAPISPSLSLSASPGVSHVSPQLPKPRKPVTLPTKR
ncbi:KIF2A [Symbiodinium natans]|uniref:KIF2A protein n=1 Tax=Symbiodinium natans TaxID=878477 RepID=A0A812M8W9_9DINO|nr:KIF2A [Symbiodinium natans]